MIHDIKRVPTQPHSEPERVWPVPHEPRKYMRRIKWDLKRDFRSTCSKAMTWWALRCRSLQIISQQTGCASAPLDGFQAVQKIEGRCPYLNLREFRKNLNGVVAHSELDICEWTSIVSICQYSGKKAVWCSFSLFRCAEMPRNGSGAQCQKCPVNTFSDVYSSGKLCTPCPAASKSPEGSTSRSSCICDVGALDNSTGSLALLQPSQLGKKRCAWPCFPKRMFDFPRVKLWSVQKSCVEAELLTFGFFLGLEIWSKVRKCGCPKDEAKSSDICVKCQELFLNCSKPGAEVHSASPLPNYTRLDNESRAYKCLPPASRCNANLSDPLSQVKGVSNMKAFVVNISMFPSFDVSWT